MQKAILYNRNLWSKVTNFFKDLFTKDISITIRFMPKPRLDDPKKLSHRLSVWSEQSLEDSLLGARLLSPFIKDENNVYTALINDYRQQRPLQLSIDLEINRCYLHSVFSDSTILLSVIILPYEVDEWPNVIYSKVFPKFAI